MRKLYCNKKKKYKNKKNEEIFDVYNFYREKDKCNFI